LLNLGAFATRALDAFFIVIADGHGERESLATFLAKIFVKRHRGSPLWSFFDVADDYYNSTNRRFQPARLARGNTPPATLVLGQKVKYWFARTVLVAVRMGGNNCYAYFDFR
jgi:hypothetical protein